MSILSQILKPRQQISQLHAFVVECMHAVWILQRGHKKRRILKQKIFIGLPVIDFPIPGVSQTKGGYFDVLIRFGHNFTSNVIPQPPDAPRGP